MINQKALPGLGILTAAAAAKKAGCEVEFLDFANGKQYSKADIHGLYVLTPDFQTSVEILNWLKNKGAKRVICGGPHANFEPKECLKAGFDAVSIGDAEVTFPLILKGDSLAYGWLRKFDEALHPDRTIVDLKEYDFRIGGVQATSMMTSVGCVWRKCVFCSRPPYDLLKYHNISWVLDELDEIQKLGFKAVQIYDDEFFTNPMRDSLIVKAMGERDLIWRCFGHSRFLLSNKRLVTEASLNGLWEVLIGVESGSNRILGIINKGTTVEVNKKAIRMLHKVGIKVKCAMIIGLPSESPETLKETWRFCEEMDHYVSDWDFTVFSPYPGSEVYNHPEKFDIKFNKGEYTAFKGSLQPGWKRSGISTSRLKNETILQIRDQFETRFKNTRN